MLGDERSGPDPGRFEGHTAGRQFDRTQRTADRLAEQAAWATRRRRRSVYRELRAAWIAITTGQAA